MAESRPQAWLAPELQVPAGDVIDLEDVRDKAVVVDAAKDIDSSLYWQHKLRAHHG